MKKNTNEFLLNSLRTENKIKNPNTAIIDKQFLLESVQDEENDTLSKFKPKKLYLSKEKLELNLRYQNIYVQGAGIIGQNPLAISPELKTFIPITFFGLTDYFSSYYTSLEFVLKKAPSWTVKNVGVYNFNTTGVIDLNPSLEETSGDMIRYFDGTNNWHCYTVLSTSNQIGYGTILNSLSDSIYIIKNIRIRVNTANIDMFDYPLIFSRLKLNGQIETDSINIRTYVKPSDFNTSIVDLPLNILLDKNLMINQAIKYDCQEVNYYFTLMKIK